jgi:pSer/pThr/pTyr-binding forkhead associated (FHA) protein
MDDYIDVKINVFEHTGQRARVRKSITVKTLVDEILKEFDDIDNDSPEKYSIQIKGMENPLNVNQTLAQLDIQPQDELNVGYLHQTIRKMLDPKDQAELREETSNITFDIQWTPAIVGRPSTEVNHNIMLAVNMQILTVGITISRKHAQIIFSEGNFFVEPSAANNPTFLNGRMLPVNSMNKLTSGDRLAFGTHKVSFIFTTKSQPANPARGTSEPISRPPTGPAAPSDSPHTQIDSGRALMPALVIEKSLNPANIGEKIPLQNLPLTIGRVIPIFSSEGDISRQHAEINFDPGKKMFTIRDLESTNGVTLNGQKINPDMVYELLPGMKVGLGKVMLLRFER